MLLINDSQSCTLSEFTPNGGCSFRDRHGIIARVANFNDRCKDFERIRAVILKARTLAERDVERLPQIIAAIDAAFAAEKKFWRQRTDRPEPESERPLLAA